ncbi:MAG: polyphenol oxidase family protein, partial [Bryobacteraceae bacterium]
ALGDGDALITSTAGVRVAVRTADCVPILLVDPVRRAIAAVHAGWRGTVAGIAAKTVRAMTARFGTRGADLHAALGPGIGECCFEVGPEVAVQFGRHGRVHVDLYEHLSRQLLAEAVPAQSIYTSRLCSVCSGSGFHSYRRDGNSAGRMLNFVGKKHEGREMPPAPVLDP